MEILQKNRSLFISCCESNNIFSHVEMDKSLIHNNRGLKQFSKTIKFPDPTYTNLNSINSDPIFKRRKRVNVVVQTASTTKIAKKTNKIKLKQIMTCAVILIIVNLIVILYS